MAKVYAARSGVTEAEAARMMDEETWIGAAQAVEDGFADGLLDGAAATKDGAGVRWAQGSGLGRGGDGQGGHSDPCDATP